MLRNDRQLNQSEMADLLGVSQSAYSRIERNESSVDIEDMMRFSKILNVPVQEFLPETMSVHYENHQGQGGPNLIFGDFHYHGPSQELTQTIAQLCNVTATLLAKYKDSDS
jgi:DNA-binding XRE family transcriptional regulator